MKINDDKVVGCAGFILAVAVGVWLMVMAMIYLVR